MISENFIPLYILHSAAMYISSIMLHAFMLCNVVLFFLKKIIYLVYIYEYTVTVLRHARRGHQIPLQMAVNHHVVLGIELRTSGRAVSALKR